MAVTFTRAPTFTVDGLVTAADHGKLADAFDGRMRSDLGNPTYRIQQYFARNWRMVRASASNLTPSAAEFLETYIHVDPRNVFAEWPTVPPGEDGGANLANPAMAFVFGNPNTFGEGDRLNDVPIAIGSTTDVRGAWELGKIQRGFYDPTAVAYTAPAFAAAQSFFRVMFPSATGVSDPWGVYLGTFHGKGYGGYLPVPEVVSHCGDGRPIQRIKFTNLVDGTQRTWLTACTEETETDRVLWVAAFPFAYYIWLSDGSIVTLNRKEWIEGLYTGGGKLQKSQGEQIARLMLNQYVADYRGTVEQRAEAEWCVQDHAWLSQEFGTRQYYLAPAKGTLSGGTVSGSYPAWSWGGASVAAGTTGTAHQIAAGFTAGLIHARADGLVGSVALEILNGAAVADTIQLTADAGGLAQLTITFPNAWTPNLNVRFATAATFQDSTGRLVVECAEIMDYKPELHDAYLCVRLSTCRGSLFARIDGPGYDEELAREAFDAYDGMGCIVNQYGSLACEQQTVGVNENPAFDAARRFTRACTRVLSRRNLIGYAVENGKSVLWFDRIVPLSGENLDCLDGIADAIATSAPVKGETNEWLMFAEFFAYHTSESSIWKPSSYADIFLFNNPAHFYSERTTPLGSLPDLARHFSEGPPYPFRLIYAEAAKAHTYAEGANNLSFERPDWGSEERTGFYRSRQIYRPDYEIESAVTNADGRTVKITFKTRFQHDHNLSADIGRDPNTWDVDAIKAEVYRTDENAIREYMVFMNNGSNASVKIGDQAASSILQSQPDNPFGTVFPRFFFTRLVPTPHAGGDPNGALITFDRFAQMETYLRAMCEGYVDSETTSAYSCLSTEEFSDAWDFTFENLCYHAFGGRWIGNIPPTQRNDMPQGFGPLPTNFVYAEGLNQISACINALNKVRVPMPYVLEYKQASYTGAGTTTGDWPSGVTAPSSKVIAFEASFPGATTESSPFPADWIEGPIPGAGVQGNMLGSGAGSTFDTESFRTVTQYRLRVANDEQFYALDESVRDMLNPGSLLFLGRVINEEVTTRAVLVPSLPEAAGCAAGTVGWFWDGGSGTGYRFEYVIQPQQVACSFLSSGTLDAGTAPPAGDASYGLDAGQECKPGVSSKGKYITNVRLTEAIIEVPIVS